MRDLTGANTLRPWRARAVLHVDLDAFFAAVEQLDRPEWRGRPVIVGGDPERRGVVATASYEARAYGVRSAMPSSRAAALCPDAVWVRPDIARYRTVSRQVMDVLRSFTPFVEPVSIDEAYLDVSPGRFSTTHPVKVAIAVRARIAGLGLTASVGVATSKSVAKVASDHHKPDGLTVVWPGSEAAFLAPLHVSVLTGVGPQTASRLTALGVRTLGELAALDCESAYAALGPDGPRLVLRARGVDDTPVKEPRRAKSVSNEQTFAHDVRTTEELDRELRALVAKVTRRLNEKVLAGRTITLKIRFSDFSTRSSRRTLDHPTCDEDEIFAAARGLLESIWTPGVGVRLLGVGVSALSEQAHQLDLLTTAAPPPDVRRHAHLLESVAAVKRRFGRDALRFGSELDPPTGEDT